MYFNTHDVTARLPCILRRPPACRGPISQVWSEIKCGRHGQLRCTCTLLESQTVHELEKLHLVSTTVCTIICVSILTPPPSPPQTARRKDTCQMGIDLGGRIGRATRATRTTRTTMRPRRNPDYGSGMNRDGGDSLRGKLSLLTGFSGFKYLYSFACDLKELHVEKNPPSNPPFHGSGISEWHPFSSPSSSLRLLFSIGILSDIVFSLASFGGLS